MINHSHQNLVMNYLRSGGSSTRTRPPGTILAQNVGPPSEAVPGFNLRGNYASFWNRPVPASLVYCIILLENPVGRLGTKQLSY
jgi:hypothetical protein